MNEKLKEFDQYLFLNYPVLRSSGVHYFVFYHFKYFLILYFAFVVYKHLLVITFPSLGLPFLEDKFALGLAYLITIFLWGGVYLQSKLKVLNVRYYATSLKVNLSKYLILLFCSTLTTISAIILVNKLFDHENKYDWREEIQNLSELHSGFETFLSQEKVWKINKRDEKIAKIEKDSISKKMIKNVKTVVMVDSVQVYKDSINSQDLITYLKLLKKYIIISNKTEDNLDTIVTYYDYYYNSSYDYFNEKPERLRKFLALSYERSLDKVLISRNKFKDKKKYIFGRYFKWKYTPYKNYLLFPIDDILNVHHLQVVFIISILISAIWFLPSFYFIDPHEYYSYSQLEEMKELDDGFGWGQIIFSLVIFVFLGYQTIQYSSAFSLKFIFNSSFLVVFILIVLKIFKVYSKSKPLM